MAAAMLRGLAELILRLVCSHIKRLSLSLHKNTESGREEAGGGSLHSVAQI